MSVIDRIKGARYDSKAVIYKIAVSLTYLAPIHFSGVKYRSILGQIAYSYMELNKKDFEPAERYILDARKYGYFDKEFDYYNGKALAYQHYHIDTSSYTVIGK